MNTTNTTTTVPNQTPNTRKRRPRPSKPMSIKELEREIASKEAEHHKQGLEIERLKLALAHNAREQKAQSGMRVIVRTLQGLHPGEVSTFLGLLSAYVTAPGDLEDLDVWQQMHADAAATSQGGQAPS